MMQLGLPVKACMSPEGENPEYFAANYCIGLIDLLGQQDALRGQGVLPAVMSEVDKIAVDCVIRESIAPAFKLQRDVENIVKNVAPNPNSPIRNSLSVREQAIYDEIQLKRVETQYWSDGFIRFVCFGDKKIKCHMLGVTEIFQFSGYFCLLGLAQRHPVRGAIDIAWGVELPHSGLYGPVVANAYKLESEVAEYPRIVVGQQVLDSLEMELATTGDDPFTRTNHQWAKLCRDMLLKDTDGHWIVHYLGAAFRHSVTHTTHDFIYKKAHAFVIDQLEEHRQSRNTKLESRYSRLVNYFGAHPSSS